jgi:NAD(P)H-hydrate epimerase
MPDEDGKHTAEGAEQVVELAERAGAVVLGPGLGRADGPTAFALAVAQGVRAPLLVDADGLNAHVGKLESLTRRDADTVLTPHEAELGRLLEMEPAEVAERRVANVREVSRRSGAVVVLKGDDSIVAAPGRPLAVSPGATPALATAGTGDVLSGVIGALLAKGLGGYEAAAAGVLAHALAGRHAAERFGTDHVVAGDVIESLPAAFAERPDGGSR